MCSGEKLGAAKHPTECAGQSLGKDSFSPNTSSAGAEKAFLNCVIVLCVGIKESDTGLAPPALWDLAADKQTLQSEQPLQVARYAHALWDFVFIPKRLELGTNIVLKY